MQTILNWGAWGLLLLGFIDSAGIPISPGLDALVILVAVKSPQYAWFAAGMAVVGSVAGNLTLYELARRGGRRFASSARDPEKPRRFRAWFDRYGLATVFVPAMVPIPLPLKVFVISAGVLRTPLRSFLAVIILARILRYFGEAWLGVALGQHSMGYLKSHAWHLVGASLLLFVFIYFLIRMTGHKNAEV